jgi:hypothetical protein
MSAKDVRQLNEDFLQTIPHRVLRDFSGPIDLPSGRFMHHGVVVVTHPSGALDVLTRNGQFLRVSGPTTAVPLDLAVYPHAQLKSGVLEALNLAITRRKQRTHELERLERRLCERA